MSFSDVTAPGIAIFGSAFLFVNEIELMEYRMHHFAIRCVCIRVERRSIVTEVNLYLQK